MHPEFESEAALQQKIDAYFTCADTNPTKETQTAKSPKTATENPQLKNDPLTLCGMMLHLGFDSRDQFEDYEVNGTYATTLKRAKLRIEAEYERKLHYQSPTGAIFALKNLGWNERESRATLTGATKLQIEIVNTTHIPASSEQDVSI